MKGIPRPIVRRRDPAKLATAPRAGYNARVNAVRSIIALAAALALASSPAGAARKASAARKLCWQGYCPCTGPYRDGPDFMICRQLRAGIHVEPRILAAASGLRDARRQMAEFSWGGDTSLREKRRITRDPCLGIETPSEIRLCEAEHDQPRH